MKNTSLAIALFALTSFSTSLLAGKVDIAPGVSIKEEEGFDDGHFLPFSNEGHLYHWKDVLAGRQGAYLDVGSDRVFTLASFGNFDTVYVIDSDSRANGMAVGYASLIEEIAELGFSVPIRRQLFVMALHNFWPNVVKGSLPKFLASPALAPYAPWLGKDMDKTLRDLSRAQEQEDDAEYPLDDGETLPPDMMPTGVREAVQFLIEHAQSDHVNIDQRGLWPHLCANYASDADNKSKLGDAPWASDASYAKLENLVRAPRIIPIIADFIGSRALKQLAVANKKIGRRIETIGLSDVLAHLAGDAKKKTWEKAANKLIRNLDALTEGHSALVLFTTGFSDIADKEALIKMNPHIRIGGQWIYFAVPYSILRETLISSNALRSSKDYQAMLQAAVIDPRWHPAAHVVDPSASEGKEEKK